jgi:hypothetical protein
MSGITEEWNRKKLVKEFGGYREIRWQTPINLHI